MPRFRVTFRKVVYGNTGHAYDICQRIVEVKARDSEAAQVTAIRSFCDLENVTNWLHHADRMEVAVLARTAHRSIRDVGDRRAA
jgi:hypothetical protein